MESPATYEQRFSGIREGDHMANRSAVRLSRLIALILSTFVWVFQAPNLPGANEDGEYHPVQPRWIIILGSYKDFEQAHKQGLTISHASKVPFSMQGLTYDKKVGVVFSGDHPDAGTYIARRDHTRILNEGGESGYISIERSDGYQGFAPGYYIIVGGIYSDRKESRTSLARFQAIIPDAYIKKSKIYMGCLH